MDSADDILKRVPPQDISAEQSVLGAIFLDNQAINEIVDSLPASAFYRESHHVIYETLIEQSRRLEPMDAITTCAALRSKGILNAIGGAGYIAELAASVPTAANITHYARIVREKAVLRRIATIATEVAADAYDNPLDVPEFADRVARAITEVCDTSVRSQVVTAPDLMRSTLIAIERAYEHKELVTGLSTGLIDLDRMTGGLQPSDLLIIAARPSLGKTSLALNIAAHAAIRARTGVLFFSLEMSKEQLGIRLVAAESRISGRRIRQGIVSDAELRAIGTAAGAVAESPIVIDDASFQTPLSIMATARRVSRRRPLGLIVVDYIQLLASSRARDSREREVAEISRALKALAKEFRIPVIALSQLNRKVEDRAIHRPSLADLRESGAIEQDADVVAFIHDPEMYRQPEERDRNAPRLLILAKQRNGPQGDIKLAWLQECMRFDNYAEPPGAFAAK